jgi:phospholipid/cholesterol/gamma-HCH transport system substrate-binding protein
MRRPRPRIVGALIVVLVPALVALGYTKPNPFADTRTVRVVFDDAAGLGDVDRDVRIGGVNLGRIGEVRRSGDDAIVELELEPDAPEIHRDASAELRPHTAFEGTAFVELHPGSPSAPPLGDATIPRSRTRVYVSLDKALRALDRPTRVAIGDLAPDLADALLPPTPGAVQRMLRGLPELTRDLALGARALQGPHGDELTGAIDGLSRTVRALSAEQGRLVPFLAGAHRTFAALDADRGGALDRTLAELPGAYAALDRGGTALRSALDRLDPLAADLRPAMAELPEALRRTRPLLREGRAALGDLRPFLADLRPALDAGARATPPSRALLRALDPTLRLLDGSLLPFMHTRTRLGLPVYRQVLAYTSGSGTLASFQTEEQNPAGAGHVFRFDVTPLTGAGPLLPRCGDLEALNPEFAERAKDAELCQP